MPKYKQVNNELIEIKGNELVELEAKEQAWKDGAFDRALNGLRFKRNKFLSETDWWASSDLTMTDEQKKYRQDLRDITNGLTTVKKIEKVVFPNKPE